MITGTLKNKIDNLWEIFWTGGLTNPLDVIEQMTYLMFIHDLDEADDIHAKESTMLGVPYQSIFAEEVQLGSRVVDGRQLKWSVFRDYPPEKMFAVVQEMVFPFIKNLHDQKDSAYSKYMQDAIFKIPTPLMLSKIVGAMDELYGQMKHLGETDARGDVYEYLLSKLSNSGVNGQFRTPRHIIKMMVELMAPTADETICDPACGTSGFLVASAEYLKNIRKEEIYTNMTIEERRRIFNKMVAFFRKINIRYKCFYIEKKHISDVVEATGKLSKLISGFIREHYQEFLSFDDVKIYYDNGQVEVSKILSSVFNALLPNPIFRKVMPTDYKFFQVADLLCSMELIKLKIENNMFSKSEKNFFGSMRDLKKNYLKPISKKEWW